MVARDEDVVYLHLRVPEGQGGRGWARLAVWPKTEPASYTPPFPLSSCHRHRLIIVRPTTYVGSFVQGAYHNIFCFYKCCRLLEYLFSSRYMLLRPLPIPSLKLSICSTPPPFPLATTLPSKAYV